MSTILASLLPTGSVSYLFYADRLNQLPLGVIGIAISTTLLPILSARVQAEDQPGVRRYTGQALDFGLMLGLPAALGLGLAATPIIHVLFEHGAFMAKDTVGTSAALAAYALGILPFILIKILSTLFFAHHDIKTPVRIAIMAVALNIAFSLLLLKPLAHVGVALATSLASWVNVACLVYALRRRDMLHIEKHVWLRAGKILLSAALMAGFLYITKNIAEAQIALYPKWVDVGVLFAYLALAMLIYGAALRISGAVTLRQVKAIISKAEETDGT